jgi:hypothetical protein
MLDFSCGFAIVGERAYISFATSDAMSFLIQFDTSFSSEFSALHA